MAPHSEDQAGEEGFGCSVWVSLEPSSEEVAELIRWFSEIVKLPKEVQVETTEWAATAVVARSLGRCVSMEAVIIELRQWAGVKGEVVGYNLELGHLLFWFVEAGDRELALNRPWVVAGQVLAAETW